MTRSKTCGAAPLAKMVTQKCKEIGSKSHKHVNRSTLARFEKRNTDRKWVDKTVSSTVANITLQ